MGQKCCVNDRRTSHANSGTSYSDPNPEDSAIILISVLQLKCFKGDIAVPLTARRARCGYAVGGRYREKGFTERRAQTLR